LIARLATFLGNFVGSSVALSERVIFGGMATSKWFGQKWASKNKWVGLARGAAVLSWKRKLWFIGPFPKLGL